MSDELCELYESYYFLRHAVFVMSDAEIDKMVKKKYPVTDNEKTCQQDRLLRNKMRKEYREKLIKEKLKLNHV